MATIVQTTGSRFARFFAGLHRPYPYRWYEVEVACFRQPSLTASGDFRPLQIEYGGNFASVLARWIAANIAKLPRVRAAATLLNEHALASVAPKGTSG